RARALAEDAGQELLHLGFRRTPKGLGRCLFHYPTLMEQVDAIREGEGPRYVVSHYEGGHTELLLELRNQTPDQPGGARIQPRGGLVEQHDLGRERQRAGNADALLHTPAQLAGIPVLDPRHPDAGEEGGDPVADLRLAP